MNLKSHITDATTSARHDEIIEILKDLKLKFNEYQRIFKHDEFLIDDMIIFGGYLRDIIDTKIGEPNDVDVHVTFNSFCSINRAKIFYNIMKSCIILHKILYHHL